MKRLLIILVLFISYSFTFAQNETTGTISGHVWESDGVTPISNAGVSAEFNIANFGKSTISNLDGSYLIDKLPVGNYLVCTRGTYG